MALGQHRGEQVLYVADAFTLNSSILVYSNCDTHGRRKYITQVASTASHPGVDHSYGLCFDHHDNIYASFQHTDNVLRFKKDSFKPMQLPVALVDENPLREYYPGTFTQFGQPKRHKTDEHPIYRNCV